MQTMERPIVVPEEARSPEPPRAAARLGAGRLRHDRRLPVAVGPARGAAAAAERRGRAGRRAAFGRARAPAAARRDLGRAAPVPRDELGRARARAGSRGRARRRAGPARVRAPRRRVRAHARRTPLPRARPIPPRRRGRPRTRLRGKRPRRSPRPPTALRTPTRSNKLRVAVIGDSLSQGLGPAIERWMNPSVVRVLSLGRQSTGLSREDYFNWQAGMRQIVEEFRPDLVFVLLGSNDAQAQISRDGTAIPVGSVRWLEGYRERAADLLREATRAGTHVVWVGIPIVKERQRWDFYRRVNDIYRDTASADPLGTYVDTWDPVRGPGRRVHGVRPQRARRPRRGTRSRRRPLHADGVRVPRPDGDPRGRPGLRHAREGRLVPRLNVPDLSNRALPVRR